MLKHRFHFESTLPFPSDDVFSWHLREGALERLVPPWINARVVKHGSPKQVGSKTILRFGFGPFHTDWVAEHTHFVPGKEFADKERKGPFRFWHHIHKVEDLPSGSLLEDDIEYALPFFLSNAQIKQQLHRQFAWRHKRVLYDLTTFSLYEKTTKKILVSGSRGLVGSSLCAFLTAAGHEVWHLQRDPSNASAKIIGWDPQQDGKNGKEFEGFDAVVHLAGENIGNKRWSPKHKEKIFRSRCRDTWLLSHILSRLKNPPKVFLSASAIGIYGDRGSEVLTEESSYGSDFLADVCIHWEKASEILNEVGIRRCLLRFGYVLSPKGGMLRPMIPLFRLGLGGKLGSGKQIMPWIALDDVIYAIYHCIMKEEIQGPVNVVAPSPVKQVEFARTLAKALRSTAFARVPTWFLKMVLGEKADALIFRSANAEPTKLLKSGFTFCYRELKSYLKESL